jgi:hypothetical protein
MDFRSHLLSGTIAHAACHGLTTSKRLALLLHADWFGRRSGKEPLILNAIQRSSKKGERSDVHELWLREAERRPR